MVRQSAILAVAGLMAPFAVAPDVLAKQHVTSSALIPPPKKVEPVPEEVFRNRVPRKTVEAPPQEPLENQGEPATPQPPIEEGGSLNLMCFGGGAANKLATGTAFGWNAFGSAGATIVTERSQGFDDQVSLRMTATEGRLRMPRSMLPAIRGGEDGWFKLHDIKIKAGEITASVGVNAFNNPKLVLDRYFGAISIAGKAGNYNGRCRRYDPEAARKQF